MRDCRQVYFSVIDVFQSDGVIQKRKVCGMVNIKNDCSNSDSLHLFLFFLTFTFNKRGRKKEDETIAVHFT